MIRALPTKKRCLDVINTGILYRDAYIALNISKCTFYRLIKKYNIMPSLEARQNHIEKINKSRVINLKNIKTKQQPKFKHVEIQALLDAGHLVGDIAHMLHTSRRTIYNYISRHNLKRNENGTHKKNLILRNVRANAAKSLWERPGFKQKIVSAAGSPDSILKMVSSLKHTLSLPVHKERMSRWSKAYWSNIGNRRKHAIIMQEKMPKTMTAPHLKVCSTLDALSIKHETEKAVGPWNFDVFIPSKNLLIEVQGDYWHSLPNNMSRDSAKSTYIKEYFPQYQLKYIWEHECLQENKVLSKLKYWLGLDKIEQVEYDFKNVGIRQIDNVKLVDSFLYNHHYQHHGRHGLDFGCYLGEELIAVARFTSAGRKESAEILGFTHKEVLELARLCVHPKYQKKNLLSWFIARVEKQIKLAKPGIKCLISFADSTYNHTGSTYKASNWELNRVVEPNYWYVDSEGFVIHKKTLWNHSSKNHMSESDYATKYGYTKVWGKEKYKFIKRLVF